MICDHPECTGKHGGNGAPKAEWCPVAQRRHSDAVNRRKRERYKSDPKYKAKVLEQAARYRAKPEVRERVGAYMRKYRAEHREDIREYHYQNDNFNPQRRIQAMMKNRKRQLRVS